MGLETAHVFKKVPQGMSCIALEGEVLRTYQLFLLDILQDIADCCERHNIDYTIVGGTLLGSVRHGGFIPWDDDIDIAMRVDDFWRFSGFFLAECGDDYLIQDPEHSKNYGLPLARVRRKGTVVRTRDDFHTDECGAFVDIFFYRNTSTNKLVQCIDALGSLFLGFGLSCRRFAEFSKEYLEFAEDDPAVRRVFKFKIAMGRLFSFASMDAWARAWFRWDNRHDAQPSPLFLHSVEGKNYFSFLMPVDEIFPSKFYEFEGRTFRGPQNVHTVLSPYLGENYMELPPEDKREVHVVYEFDLGEGASKAPAEQEQQ